MNKIRTSLMLSAEAREIADELAEAQDRTRSYILDKAITIGLDFMANQQAHENTKKTAVGFPGKKAQRKR